MLQFHPATRIAWIALCLMLLVGCLAPRSSAPRSASDLDRKLDQTAFIEEGNLLALIVDTRVAFSRDNPDYLALEVAIVNKGMSSLSITPESFTLVDDQKASYPVVDGDEVGRKHNVDVDRRLGTVRPVVRGRYSGYSEQVATLTTSFDRPIRRNLYLPRFSWAADMLYFPRPSSGVRGHVFELLMKTSELDDPVFVRFKVAGSKNGEE